MRDNLTVNPFVIRMLSIRALLRARNRARDKPRNDRLSRVYGNFHFVPIEKFPLSRAENFRTGATSEYIIYFPRLSSYDVRGNCLRAIIVHTNATKFDYYSRAQIYDFDTFQNILSQEAHVARLQSNLHTSLC